jgi:hypothetical protein
MGTKELETRVSALEQKLAEMTKRVDAILGNDTHPNPHGPWWQTTAGRFKDDPVFDEIVRLGREYRESMRPDRSKKKNTKRKK